MECLPTRESETVEFKEEWSDRALEDIAAFANTSGGDVYIGISDDGRLVGFECAEHQEQGFVNKITNTLGLRPSMRWLTMSGNSVLVIAVSPASQLITLKGRYWMRVGSTNRKMNSREITRKTLELIGEG